MMIAGIEDKSSIETVVKTVKSKIQFKEIINEQWWNWQLKIYSILFSLFILLSLFSMVQFKLFMKRKFEDKFRMDCL